MWLWAPLLGYRWVGSYDLWMKSGQWRLGHFPAPPPPSIFTNRVIIPVTLMNSWACVSERLSSDCTCVFSVSPSPDGQRLPTEEQINVRISADWFIALVLFSWADWWWARKLLNYSHSTELMAEKKILGSLTEFVGVMDEKWKNMCVNAVVPAVDPSIAPITPNSV